VNQSGVEEGAILQLQIQDQSSVLYWDHPDQGPTALVDLSFDLNEFDQNQWNQIFSVDYL
jgi:hypothetical protein